MAAFQELKSIEDRHEKVKNNVYNKFKSKEYHQSTTITKQEADVKTAFRSQTVFGISTNFNTLYGTDQEEILNLRIVHNNGFLGFKKKHH